MKQGKEKREGISLRKLLGVYYTDEGEVTGDEVSESLKDIEYRSVVWEKVSSAGVAVVDSEGADWED